MIRTLDENNLGHAFLHLDLTTIGLVSIIRK